MQDKSKFDKADAKRKIEGWLKLNYCYLMGGLDVQYIHIKPRIIAEKVHRKRRRRPLRLQNFLFQRRAENYFAH